MVSYDKVCAIAKEYSDDLREFRLDGDIGRLMNFLEAVIGADKLILKDDFFKALTTNETTAFEAIVQEIGSSGNISVVKMIQKTNLSRPVWTALLQKMEKYGVAAVKSQGVKGTYIQFMEGL